MHPSPSRTLATLGTLALGSLALTACASDNMTAGGGSGAEYDDASSGAGGSGGGGGGNTNVAFGGAQDFGYFRRLLQDGIVPTSGDIDAPGFFAEHHTPLPEPVCGERICLQAMLGVMGNLIDGSNCTLLQLGLNSPIDISTMERPPLRLAVVVDVSGSMEAAGKIDFVRDGLRTLVNELLDGDELALITYSSEAEVLSPMQGVSGRRNELHDLIDALEANGGTNLYAGLEAGYQEVSRGYDAERQNRVILLSDGQPTAGITRASDILAMSAAYNSEGLGITSIGLGTDFNYELMSALARDGDGNYYFVEDSSAVDEVFSEELSYFTVPVAFDLHLELTVGEHYDLGRARGASSWRDTNRGGELDIPSVFLAHRISHDDVGPGDERRGGGSMLLVEVMPHEGATSDPDVEVATIELSYREPGSSELRTESVTAEYPHAVQETLSVGFFEDRIVEKSFVVLNVLGGLELSCDAFHDGEELQAVAILERLIAAAEDYEDSANGGEGDVDIRLDIELMEELRDVMLENGAGDPSDEVISEDPWPAD